MRSFIVLSLAIVALTGCRAATAMPPDRLVVAEPSPLPTSTPLPPLPTPTTVPTQACLDQAGEWVDFSYDGVAVVGRVPARVYLPPCYDFEARRFPVAYFLHGKPYDESHWLDLGLASLVEQRAGDGALPPMILVLARLPEPIFSGSDGGPGSYETEFLEGLVASVDQSFRTEASADGRALLGISRGGVWALEIGLRNSDRISAVAALSPALAVNHARPAYDPQLLASTAPALPSQWLLGAGDSDWARPGTEAFAEKIRLRDAALGVVLVPGDHSDPTWSSMLPAVLDFLAAAFSDP